ncbi:MAG: WxL domain-containing protein [Chloroflexi bacterium]|nr:WxL domain-containing protein [Chloroflexota bacterium]
MIKRILAVGAVLAVLATTAVMASAESATVTVTAGTLSLTTNAVALPGITLSGVDQTTATTAGDDTFNVADGRGSGAGYNVTIDTTDFTAGGTIDTGTGNFDISLQDAAIVVVGGSATKPTSSVTALTDIPESPAAALKVLSAAVSAGQGSYDWDPVFSLTIPSESDAGSYSATITLTIASGP